MSTNEPKIAGVAVKRRSLTFAGYAFAFGVILFLGALNLPYPLVSDQLISMIAAQTLSSGGTLYVDFWDNKLPGLVWFHELAGTWFGYSEIGLHALELLWMSAFALILGYTLRTYYEQRWMSAAAMVAVVGTYYASAETFHLAQLEMLVGLPTFLALWLACQWPTQRAGLMRNFFLSGVCAGITVVFKIVFAPLFVVFWSIASIGLWRSRTLGIAGVIRVPWLPVAAGTALILAAVAVRFWLDDALYELIYTAFIYPPQAFEIAPRAPNYRLLDSLVWFGSYFGVWSLFIGVACVHWWRGARETMTPMLLAWLVVGFVLILIQRFSWWSYHFLFLFTPAGVLGVRGIDVVVQHLGARAPVRGAQLWTAMLAIAMLSGLAPPAGQKFNVYINAFFRKAGGIRELQQAISIEYAQVEHSIRFLHDAGARKGPIYVFGKPTYYYLSGRRPALPIIGSAWDYYPLWQWRELPEQLRAARPAYIYVDAQNAELIRRRGDLVEDFMRRYYVPLLQDHNGTWFAARAQPLMRNQAPGANR